MTALRDDGIEASVGDRVRRLALQAGIVFQMSLRIAASNPICRLP
jgi:hypothetical protein